MIILDTNVISERFRSAPDKRVDRWFDSIDQADAATTVITIAELRFGAARLPQGRRRAALELWIDDLVADNFCDRIEEFGLAQANAYASIRAKRHHAGRPIAFQDAQIAAICITRQAVLATRNTKDFDDLGITLINPWEH